MNDTELQAWEIESGPITEARLSPYITVGYSIRCPDGTFRLVQRVAESKAGYEEAHNRARLIAAAPELLEALETALAFFYNPSSFEPLGVEQKYRAAIRKARGEA